MISDADRPLLDAALAERRQHLLDVADEGLVRAHDEHAGARELRVGVQQPRRPVQADRGLPGARPALDHERALAVAADQLVLVRRDRRDDLAHLAHALARDVLDDRLGQVVVALGHQRLVDEAEHRAVLDVEPPPAPAALRIVRRRGVERLRGGRAPVDRQQVVVRAPDRVAPDVERVARRRCARSTAGRSPRCTRGCARAASAPAPRWRSRRCRSAAGARSARRTRRRTPRTSRPGAVARPRSLPPEDRRLHAADDRPARNLVNLKDVTKGYAARTVLHDVTLGVSAGDRIGVVGRNGDGKSTLLRLIAGIEEPDAGAVTRVGGLQLQLLGQGDDLHDGPHGPRGARRRPRRPRVGAPTRASATCSTACSAASRCAASRRAWTRRSRRCRGGERRRIALAKTLLGHPELLLLDEPTNHLDVEGVDWLAHHLAARRGSMLVVTHDRWFLDAVCTHTWEVADTDRPPVRGRLRGVRARPRRARAPGRGARGAPPAADPQGARLAAPRARRRAPPSRSSGSRPPTR